MFNSITSACLTKEQYQMFGIVSLDSVETVTESKYCSSLFTQHGKCISDTEIERFLSSTKHSITISFRAMINNCHKNLGILSDIISQTKRRLSSVYDQKKKLTTMKDTEKEKFEKIEMSGKDSKENQMLVAFLNSKSFLTKLKNGFELKVEVKPEENDNVVMESLVTGEDFITRYSNFEATSPKMEYERRRAFKLKDWKEYEKIL